MREPDHPVEVTQHRVDAIRRVQSFRPHRLDRCRRRPSMASCRRATIHAVPRPALLRRDIDDLIAPPYDVLSDADLDELGGGAGSTSPTSTSRASRTGPGRYDRGRDAARVDRRRGDVVRRHADVHDLPHAVHRCLRHGARHRRRARRARGRRRRRRWRTPPRARHTEGVDRSPRPHAGDAGQPVARVGAVARRRAHRAARRTRRADRIGHRRRRRPRRRAGLGPRNACRDRRQSAPTTC
jgi:hypothetical protein